MCILCVPIAKVLFALFYSVASFRSEIDFYSCEMSFVVVLHVQQINILVHLLIDESNRNVFLLFDAIDENDEDVGLTFKFSNLI